MADIGSFVSLEKPYARLQCYAMFVKKSARVMLQTTGTDGLLCSSEKQERNSCTPG